MNRLSTDAAATLARGLAQLGLPAAVAAPLLAYLDELVRWNAAYNLTAVRDPQQMVTRHLLDSLAVLPYVRGRLLDVGAGAGLPGLVLALADPGLQLRLIDSNGKKARFMRHVVRQLGLRNVEVLEGRVEDLPATPHDVILSRAFAALTDFCRLTRHLLAPGGQWLAMKGKLDTQELAGLPADIIIRETHRLTVPGLQEDRHAVIAMLRQ